MYAYLTAVCMVTLCLVTQVNEDAHLPCRLKAASEGSLAVRLTSAEDLGIGMCDPGNCDPVVIMKVENKRLKSATITNVSPSWTCSLVQALQSTASFVCFAVSPQLVKLLARHRCKLLVMAYTCADWQPGVE